MKIGIIGNGFVGKATYQLQCKDIEVKAYDIDPNLCIPRGTTLVDLMECDIIFISVPTPMNKDGSCYVNIVKEVVNNLHDYSKYIIVRSTVPVGTCDELGCHFMPEFLSEKNYMDDFTNNKDWIFGLLGNDSNFKKCITELFDLAYKNGKIKNNTLHFVSNKEAELVKIFKNCFLSTKVSFCNEMYQFCKTKHICYENVRKLAAADDRILHSHTFVPGPDGKRGFGGTCFPKDVNGFRYEMKKAGLDPYIMNAIIERNEKIDRPEKDWEANKGRAVV